MLVLHPRMRMRSAGVVARLVDEGMTVSVGVSVLVGKNVGVEVDVDMIGVVDAVTPIITGVGLKITGVREGGKKGVGGLLGSG